MAKISVCTNYFYPFFPSYRQFHCSVNLLINGCYGCYRSYGPYCSRCYWSGSGALAISFSIVLIFFWASCHHSDQPKKEWRVLTHRQKQEFKGGPLTNETSVINTRLHLHWTIMRAHLNPILAHTKAGLSNEYRHLSLKIPNAEFDINELIGQNLKSKLKIRVIIIAFKWEFHNRFWPISASMSKT